MAPIRKHSSSPFAFGGTLGCSSWYNLTDLNGFIDWKKGLKTLHGFCMHSFLKMRKLQLVKLQIYLPQPINNPSSKERVQQPQSRKLPEMTLEPRA